VALHIDNLYIIILALEGWSAAPSDCFVFYLQLCYFSFL